MLKINKISMWVLFLLLTTVSLAQDPIQKWHVKEFWSLLTTGMTEQIVLDLLGNPQDEETTITSEVWHYAGMVERDGDRILSRPRHGFLRFRVSSSGDEIRLLTWTEPDWTVITPRTERQYSTELKRIESEMRAKERQKLAEEQRRIREAQILEQQAERESIRKNQEIEAEKRRLEMIEARQQRLDDTEQGGPHYQNQRGKDPYSFTNPHSRYWFIASGTFIVMAILISIAFGFKR